MQATLCSLLFDQHAFLECVLQLAMAWSTRFSKTHQCMQCELTMYNYPKYYYLSFDDHGNERHDAKKRASEGDLTNLVI